MRGYLQSYLQKNFFKLTKFIIITFFISLLTLDSNCYEIHEITKI